MVQVTPLTRTLASSP